MQNASLRKGTDQDLPRLLEIEKLSFTTDRFSSRSFLRWLHSPHAQLLVADDSEQQDGILAYGLVVYQQGTQLSRLYSLAVHPRARRQGLGKALLSRLETEAAEEGRLAMRLEVESGNRSANALFTSLGYRAFKVITHAEDHRHDLQRMQKRIRHPGEHAVHRPSPWYRQTTDFTCGPAALLMAMGALDSTRALHQEEELDIWREATSIFMTSGHGGCHPLGLALAASRRGFQVEVWLKQRGPLFTEGVRSPEKKRILEVVHQQFRKKIKAAGIYLHPQDLKLADLERFLKNGCAVLLLTSSYRFTGQKAPHWVLVTAIDAHCIYVHDPDPEEDNSPMDCQHIPIARSDFDVMSAYGRSKLKTALVLRVGQ
ncbi:MAG: peptidase C39 family protein [Kiritimatiellia bacterium]